MSDQPTVGEIRVDKSNLYREETYSDLKVASIRRLTPVHEDGSEDSERDTLFIGETTLIDITTRAANLELRNVLHQCTPVVETRDEGSIPSPRTTVSHICSGGTSKMTSGTASAESQVP